MLIPERRGRPTLSANQLATYGAPGLVLEGVDSPGCPALWKAKYIDNVEDVGPTSYPLMFGRVAHEVLDLMEREAMGPEQAMERCWPAELGLEAFAEMKEDLLAYLDRGGPMTLLSSIASELRLEAVLFEDDVHGPIWFQGILDNLSVDPSLPNVLHAIDYKTDRGVPARDAALRSVQLMGYAWLVREHWETWFPGTPPRIVTHYDAVKWVDRQAMPTMEQIDTWHEWATAIGRQILADEEAKPIVNARCPYCPIKDDCSSWNNLPGVGESMALRIRQMDLHDRWRHREDAARVRALLDKLVKEIDGLVQAEAEAAGSLRIDDTLWELVDVYKDEIDPKQLHAEVGDRAFYGELTLTKAAVNRMLEAAHASESEKARVHDLWDRRLVGQKVKSTEATE